MSFREKPKVVTASERKNSSSDGEPEAKRRKVDASETVIVQKVMSVSSKSWLLLKEDHESLIWREHWNCWNSYISFSSAKNND